MSLSRSSRAGLGTGVLLGAASLPAPGGPLAFAALVPLLRLLLRGVGGLEAFRAGALAGALHGAAGFGWLLVVEAGEGPAPGLVLLLALPLLAAGIGGFAVAIGALARRSRGLALAAAPGAWVALESARACERGLGLPWNQLGYVLGDWPALVQGAALAGVAGLSFWIVAVNALLAGRPWLAPRAVPFLAAVLAAPLLAGARLPSSATPESDALRVAAVQPALAERARRDPRRFAANLGGLHALSREALAAPAQLLVWPESAYQRTLAGPADAFLAALAHDLSTPLVTGVWMASAARGRELRNAAVLALPDGRLARVAEKQHPVPFYERASEGEASRWLARRGAWPGRFERGRPHAPFLLPRAGAPPAAVGVLVCVDASHPEVARRLRAAGARLLVAISNEAGTGRWSGALHARITRLRAVEGRVPVVRVASRGPSLWIDAHGRIAASLPAGEAGAAAHALALAGPPSPFVRFGEARVAAAAALSAAGAGLLAFAPRRACRAPALGSPPGPRGALA